MHRIRHCICAQCGWMRVENSWKWKFDGLIFDYCWPLEVFAVPVTMTQQQSLATIVHVILLPNIQSLYSIPYKKHLNTNKHGNRNSIDVNFWFKWKWAPMATKWTADGSFDMELVFAANCSTNLIWFVGYIFIKYLSASDFSAFQFKFNHKHILNQLKFVVVYCIECVHQWRIKISGSHGTFKTHHTALIRHWRTHWKYYTLESA